MGLVWQSPVTGRISSPAGFRYSPITGAREFHDGVDVAVPTGTEVIAPKDGHVISIRYSTSFGRTLRLEHADGYQTFFAHLSHVPLEVGDIVLQGERIAYSGNTGWSTAPHLHFSIFRHGQFIDPLDYVEF